MTYKIALVQQPTPRTTAYFDGTERSYLQAQEFAANLERELGACREALEELIDDMTSQKREQ